MPIVKDACAFLVCDVVDQMETSTHTVFLGKLTEADIIEDKEPMTYAYYHKVVKGKSPKNAPTYIAQEEPAKEDSKQEKWVCSICGYVYDGETPFEDLPEDYLCPVCKQPKSVFQKK